MTATQLKELEKRLWEAADQLRANSRLTAALYSFPVLGLIYLHHASQLPYPAFGEADIDGKTEVLFAFFKARYAEGVAA